MLTVNVLVNCNCALKNIICSLNLIGDVAEPHDTFGLYYMVANVDSVTEEKFEMQ